MAAPVIYLVDDDSSVRTALTRLLRAAGYDTRMFGSAGEFLLAERTDVPGCVVLDVEMPGPTGLDLYDALLRHQDPIPVIFLTGHGDIPMSVRTIRAGAVDFLTKPVQRDMLLAAIARGLRHDEERRAAEVSRRALLDRYQKLTARERAVFERVAEGRLNKQVAAELGTSERTIKAHRAQVMHKMEARSVAELVRFADQLKG